MTGISHCRTFPSNEHGRDFVVGDVHGCFRTLQHALAALAFEPERDRLIGVGSLVARGPHSGKAVDWLEGRFTAVTRDMPGQRRPPRATRRSRAAGA